MKKIALLILAILFVQGIKAQNCNFTYARNPGTTQVDFSPNSAFSPNTYHFLWHFYDDNTTSTLDFPSHTYNTLATSVVCCDIFDSLNTLICSACDSIVLMPPTICWFNATPAGSLGILVDDPNVSSAIDITWNFGDGTPSMQGNSVTHIYSAPGVYNICMLEIEVATGDTLCSTCQATNVTLVSTGCSFTATNNPATNTTFVFAASVVPGSTVAWDYGDGGVGSGTQTSYTYNSVGTFQVCMTVTEPNGAVCISCQYITVGGGHGNCAFAYSPDSISPNTFEFAALTFDPSATQTWDFNDGTTGTGPVITHTFPVAGTYNVCLTETDSLGNTTCNFCQPVTVGTVGNCNFISTPDPLNPLTIDFQANSGFLSTVTWDFGDGSVGTGLGVQHTYAAAGTYVVCITVVTPGAVNCTVCNVITVSGSGQNCQASFLATSLGLDAYFIDMSIATSAGTTYSWDFGDGSASSIRFPQHTYALPGAYNVCLTIVSGNCTDTYCSTLLVDTIVSPILNCNAFFAIVQLAPYQVTIVNLSSGLNLNFSWDYGDGSPLDTQPYPSHLYSSVGSYNLCLTVSDANGCTSSYCDTLSVDSLGNIFRSSVAGFTINVVSPAQLTGVNEIIKNNTFSVFPNPVNSELQVRVAYGYEKAKEFRVLSVQGSEILTGSINGFNGTINVQSLSAGTYLLEISLSDGTRSYQRIIKN